jgi:hypothetical protein
MKKIIITLALVAVLSNVKSQLPFNLGVKVGFNSTKMITELKNVNDISEEAKLGYLAGAFVRINLPKIYLQPEIYYTKKAGDYQTATIPQFQNQTFTQKTILNSIDVPLLIGVKLLDLKVSNIRLMTGPVASFVTSKDVNYEVNGINIGSLPSTDLGKYNNINWAIQAGAGIDVMNFTLDVRYEWGINNISDVADMNVKSKLLNVSIGMKLF